MQDVVDKAGGVLGVGVYRARFVGQDGQSIIKQADWRRVRLSSLMPSYGGTNVLEIQKRIEMVP